MAEHAKENNPPPEIAAPLSLVPIMQAFHAESKKAARGLIKKAVSVILGDDQLSRQELKGLLALMSGFNTTNSLETLYAAQMIACHMLGMRKMANDYTDDRRWGFGSNGAENRVKHLPNLSSHEGPLEARDRIPLRIFKRRIAQRS